jgi:hypothetical protein
MQDRSPDVPKKRRRQPKIDDLPLFASDEQLSAVVMGPGKVKEWLAILPLLERRGFPSIDGLLGGRYVPAVKAYFDREWRVHSEHHVREPHGQERLGTYKGKRHRTKTG